MRPRSTTAPTPRPPASTRSVAPGALGGLGWGAASWATRATAAARTGTAALRTTMLVNGGVNAAGSEAAYLINNHDNLTWQGALGAGAGGFASGAIGGAAGPSGGTIAQHLGQRTTSVTSQLAAGGVNFAGGFTGSVIDQTISTGRVDYGNAALSGTVNAGTGELANRVAPSGNGMTSLSQHANFAPRTANGTFNFGATNTDAMWAQAGVGTLFGSTYEVVVN